MYVLFIFRFPTDGVEIPSYIFSNTSHIFDHGFLAHHRTQLIKLIIMKYINIRLKHAASSENNTAIRIRHQLTKMILFRNQ